MRIISGFYKNTPLKSPHSEKTHPMGDREKLALFNMLNGKIAEKTILDAFAGSGALGLEALSRGAKSVVFLEKSPKIAKILAENIDFVLKNDKNRAKIVVSSVENADFSTKFDLIIADPPYDFYSEALIGPLLRFIPKTGLLALSLPKTAETPVFDGFSLVSRHYYAAASIALFEKI